MLSTEGFEPRAMAALAPRSFVQQLQILPLRVTRSTVGPGILYLAFEDKLDASAAFAIERMLGLRVESGLISGSHFTAAHQRLLQSRFAPETSLRVAGFDALVAAAADAILRAKPIDAKLVRMHGAYWLRLWKSSSPEIEDLILRMA